MPLTKADLVIAFDRVLFEVVLTPGDEHAAITAALISEIAMCLSFIIDPFEYCEQGI